MKNENKINQKNFDSQCQSPFEGLEFFKYYYYFSDRND